MTSVAALGKPAAGFGQQLLQDIATHRQVRHWQPLAVLRLALAVGLHFFDSSISCSRATPTPRDRRRSKAGMVGPFVPAGDVAHRSFVSVCSSLLSPNSVAGNGDSSGPFGTLRNVFGDLRILFGAPEPRGSSHV